MTCNSRGMWQCKAEYGLRDGIEAWQAVRDRSCYPPWSASSDLCREFRTDSNGCEDCPVALSTGEDYCNGTHVRRARYWVNQHGPGTSNLRESAGKVIRVLVHALSQVEQSELVPDRFAKERSAGRVAPNSWFDEPDRAPAVSVLPRRTMSEIMDKNERRNIEESRPIYRNKPWGQE